MLEIALRVNSPISFSWAGLRVRPPDRRPGGESRNVLEFGDGPEIRPSSPGDAVAHVPGDKLRVVILRAGPRAKARAACQEHADTVDFSGRWRWSRVVLKRTATRGSRRGGSRLIAHRRDGRDPPRREPRRPRAGRFQHHPLDQRHRPGKNRPCRHAPGKRPGPCARGPARQ